MAPTTKIYLSKSKAGDPAYIESVRKILYTLDAEVLEFAGGTYNTDALLKSDVLVVVPPHSKVELDNGELYWIGKGQHEEIKEFNKYWPDRQILIVHGIEYDPIEKKSNLMIEEFYDVEVINRDWQKYYALIETNDFREPITEFVSFKEFIIPTFELDADDINSFIDQISDKNPEYKGHDDSYLWNDACNEAQRLIIEKYYEGYKLATQNPPQTTKRRIRLACITLFK